MRNSIGCLGFELASSAKVNLLGTKNQIKFLTIFGNFFRIGDQSRNTFFAVAKQGW
jgi:hypothetical protein